MTGHASHVCREAPSAIVVTTTIVAFIISTTCGSLAKKTAMSRKSKPPEPYSYFFNPDSKFGLHPPSR